MIAVLVQKFHEAIFAILVEPRLDFLKKTLFQRDPSLRSNVVKVTVFQSEHYLQSTETILSLKMRNI